MKKKEEFPVLVVMTTYMIILVMYLVTYSQKSHLLWAFFIVERLLSINYQIEMGNYLDNVEVEGISPIRTIITIAFSVLSMGIFIYTPFKYPGLFCILILGEIIDILVNKLKEKL